MRKIAFLLAATVSWGSVASAEELIARAQVAPGQEEMFVSGVQSVKSTGQNGRVALELWPAETDDFLRVFVFTANDGASPANVGVENISVSTGGEALRVFAPEDMRERVTKRAGRARFLNALGAGLGAAAANHNATSYGHISSRYGTTHHSFTNPYLAAAGRDAAFAQAEARRQNIDTAAADAKAATGEMLQMTTVMPGEKYGGPVFIERPDFKGDAATPVNLIVTFAGEEHEFHILVRKR